MENVDTHTPIVKFHGKVGTQTAIRCYRCHNRLAIVYHTKEEMEYTFIDGFKCDMCGWLVDKVKYENFEPVLPISEIASPPTEPEPPKDPHIRDIANVMENAQTKGMDMMAQALGNMVQHIVLHDNDPAMENYLYMCNGCGFTFKIPEKGNGRKGIMMLCPNCAREDITFGKFVRIPGQTGLRH